MKPLIVVGAALLGLPSLELSDSKARAEILPYTYTEKAVGWEGMLNDIAAAFDLDRDEATSAKSSVLSWVHIGPCRGHVTDRFQSSAWTIHTDTPKNYYQQAMLAMLGALALQTLHGAPHPDLCRFARELVSGE